MESVPGPMRDKGGDARATHRADRRDEFVRAAVSLWGRFGFERVHVEDIAGAAGMSKATFYFYFPSKGAILSDVAASLLGRALARANRTADSKEPHVLLAALALEAGKLAPLVGEIVLRQLLVEPDDGPSARARSQLARALVREEPRSPANGDMLSHDGLFLAYGLLGRAVEDARSRVRGSTTEVIRFGTRRGARPSAVRG